MDEQIKPINTLIFVCTGNTCRSPMAEIIYSSMKMDDDIKVMSRGLVVHFPEPINPKAVNVLINHGLMPNEHVARPFKDSETDENTLILTMTQSQKKILEDDHGINSRVYALKEYAGETGDVVDPYGGSIVEYEECFGEISRLVRKAAYRIVRENEAVGKERGNENDSTWL